MKKLLVWDLPTRLFHWILVIAVSISIYTGLTGGFSEMDIHMRSGYVILCLVLFRFCWGFIGHHYSQFRNFVKGPASCWQYFRKLKKNADSEEPGHNPLGALSIIAMLIFLLAQTITGLFANDDIMTEGPLTHLVSYELSRTLTAYHKFNFWIIAAIVMLHLAAVAFYVTIKKRSLIKPMFSGEKWVAESHDQPAYKPVWIQFILLIVAITGLIYGLLRYL